MLTLHNYFRELMNSAWENKKLEERIILEFFSHALDDFPEGKILDSESPDFIIKETKKRSLGIELTRLTAPQGGINNFNGIKVDSHERQVCELARNIFEAYRDLKLYVDVFFKTGIHIEEAQEIRLAEKIAQDINDGLNSFDPKSIYQFEVEKPSVNGIIDYIEVTYYPGIEASRWDNAGRYFVPQLTRELLIENIQSKEDKLSLYRKKMIDHCWLILFTSSFKRSTSFNINNQVEAWNIESAFDRVFLFELMDFRVMYVQ